MIEDQIDDFLSYLDMNRSMFFSSKNYMSVSKWLDKLQDNSVSLLHMENNGIFSYNSVMIILQIKQVYNHSINFNWMSIF